MLSEKIVPDFFSTFFMFPFSFKQNRKNIVDSLKNNRWEYHPYKIQHGIDYNEYVYFYPYIWDILFSKENNSDIKKTPNGVVFLKYRIPDNNNFYKVISAPEKEDNKEVKQKEIKLPLKNIFLHLFEVGVGILIFEIVNIVGSLENNSNKKNKKISYYTLDDYLLFLSNGRRIFIPFVRPEANIDYKSTMDFKLTKKNDLIINGICQSKDAINAMEAPRLIELQLGDKTITTDFSNENFLLEYPEGYKPALSNIITKLMDTSEFNYKNGDYKPIIDDRMFVHSYFSLPGSPIKLSEEGEDVIEIINSNYIFIEELKKAFEDSIEDTTINESICLWYQMIFIDWKKPSCQNTHLMKTLLKDSTYNRWTNYGTFYGFSRFSSVILSDIKEVGYIYNHFQSMYYQIAVLLLFYRGAILNFSDRSEQLSNQINDLPSRENFNRRERKKLRNILSEVDKLNREFLLFRNKFWFREITAQDQGIEIFDIWSKMMRNRELMEDVQSEISSLFEFVDSLNEKNISKKINIFTYIGGLFLPLAIITSFFGMNFKFLNPNNGEKIAWLTLQIQKLFSVIGYSLSNNSAEFVLFGLSFSVLLGLEYILYKYLLKRV